MKPELKDLVEELQMAFNESVCGSDRIAEVLADIKRTGYDVVMALDVTIGVTATDQQPTAETPVPVTVPGEFTLNDEDRAFLHALHVTAE